MHKGQKVDDWLTRAEEKVMGRDCSWVHGFLWEILCYMYFTTKKKSQQMLDKVLPVISTKLRM